MPSISEPHSQLTGRRTDGPPCPQMLDYVCIDYIRRGGKGWFAFLRNHYNVNYCRLPNGLTLVQKYAKRDSPEEDEADLKLVRAFFSGDDSAAIHNRRGEEAEDNYFNRTWEVPLIAARQPDLIVVGGVFWPLHNYVNRHKGEELLPLLPIEQVRVQAGARGGCTGTPLFRSELT